MSVDTRLTYDDYCLLPDNGRRYQIIDGELIVPEGCSAEIYRRKARSFNRVASLKSSDSLTTPLLPCFSVPLRKLVE